MHPKLVHLTLAIAGLTVFTAGCLAPVSDHSAAISPPRDPAAARTVVPPQPVAEKDYTVFPGKSESLRFHWSGGSLQGSLTSNVSAHTGFVMSGAGSCGNSNVIVVQGSIAGANTVGFSCGSVDAGNYTLTWTVTAGYAQGRLSLPKAVLMP